MNWRLAAKRALETMFWAFVPAFALSLHFLVQWKLSMLRANSHLVLSNANAQTEQAAAIWHQVNSHPAWFTWAITLLPALSVFVQQLGLRLSWRSGICLVASSPVLWYGYTAMQVVRKVFTVAE